MFFLLAQKYFFGNSGLQDIHLDIDIQNICGLEADIKIYTLIIYLVSHFVKWLPLKSLKYFVFDYCV